jgi:hypothetical protein
VAISLTMSHMILDLLGRRVLLVAGCLSVAACSESAPVVPISVSPQGVWRFSEAGVSESTLRLAPDGLFSRVVSDLKASTCVSSSGSWRTDGESLLLTIASVSNAPASGSENYRFVIQDGRLQLGETEIYTAVGSMVSCADYGFGAWTGVLRATLDGVEMLFEIVDVIVDMYGGQLQVEGVSTTGAGQSRMLLQIDGSPNPLNPRGFTVQNVPGSTNTFYGLYHPDPGSSTFSGFDTTRLSPTGTFTLSAVGPERVTATFSFRANLRVEGEAGPGGATFAQIELGRVEVVYR